MSKLDQQAQNELQTKITWKYPERSVLKSWAINAWDHDIKDTLYGYLKINIILAVIFVPLCWFTYDENFPFWQQNGVLMGMFMFVFLNPLLFTIYPRKLLIYRLTAQGFEVAGWRQVVETYRTIFYSAAAICTVLLVILIAVVPQAIVLLFIGPGGMVLVYLTMGNSQSWDDIKHFSQVSRDWEGIAEIIFYRQRHIISFNYDVQKMMQKFGYPVGSFNLFCPPDRYEEIIAFVQERMPTIPCKNGVVEIFSMHCS